MRKSSPMLQQGPLCRRTAARRLVMSVKAPGRGSGPDLSPEAPPRAPSAARPVAVAGAGRAIRPSSARDSSSSSASPRPSWLCRTRERRQAANGMGIAREARTIPPLQYHSHAIRWFIAWAMQRVLQPTGEQQSAWRVCQPGIRAVALAPTPPKCASRRSMETSTCISRCVRSHAATGRTHKARRRMRGVRRRACDAARRRCSCSRRRSSRASSSDMASSAA